MSGLEKAPERLATYGSLGPGQTNHHHLADLRGRWLKGTVRGRLVAEGWGAALGFPGLMLEDDGPVVEVDLLESPELAANWTRLDAFEGAGYCRVLTAVETSEGRVAASIYVLAREG